MRRNQETELLGEGEEDRKERKEREKRGSKVRKWRRCRTRKIFGGEEERVAFIAAGVVLSGTVLDSHLAHYRSNEHRR